MAVHRPLEGGMNMELLILTHIIASCLGAIVAITYIRRNND